MAVGARPRDIMWQFLLEAVLLCLCGGVIGIGLGRLASIFVSSKMGWPTATSVEAMVLSVSVAAAIGIVFGWYPAWKASKLDPIDALHHE
jgi:ABC-type antimicrobial peptide transport system permease subunit